MPRRNPEESLWKRFAELSRQTRRIYGTQANSVILHSTTSKVRTQTGLIVLDPFGQILCPADDAPSPFDLLESLLLLLGEGEWLLHHPTLAQTCTDPPREITPDDLPWAS